MEALQSADNTVETGNVGVSNQRIRIVTCLTPRILPRALQGRTHNISTVFELCLALDIEYEDLAAELVNYVCQTWPMNSSFQLTLAN